jgi:hypothetical protein
MIPLGTNISPVARVIDPVMETLTTVTLATSGLLVPEGIIGPVVNESITGSIALATGGLLISEGIIDPVASESVIETLTTGPIVPSGLIFHQ